jgi:hypothetical protein
LCLGCALAEPLALGAHLGDLSLRAQRLEGGQRLLETP